MASGFGTKKIAPAALLALKEALTHVYWYKSDLRSFLTHCLADPTILSRLNWSDFKRNIVSQLFTTGHFLKSKLKYAAPDTFAKWFAMCSKRLSHRIL